MSDLEKAIAALERAGFVAVGGPNASVIVWKRGWDVVRHDDTEAEVVLHVPIAKLTSLLSGLTLEDVEREVKCLKHTLAEKGNGLSAAERRGASLALTTLLQILRPQVNGDTCNREEG